MKRSVMILLMGLFCMRNTSYAGNGDLTVGGAFEMTTNANGFLPPRMTTSNRGNLAPSPGMLIYNTDDNAYNYYTSSGWKILASSLPVHDNTGASVDYALAVGETAKITYSSATSVPLHIAVSEGIYELKIFGDRSVSIPSDTGASLPFIQANNTTYSSPFTYSLTDNNGGYNNGSAATAWIGTGQTGFLGGMWGRVGAFTANISTFTKCKLMRCTVYRERAATWTRENLMGVSTWEDTTTAWTSLGTLNFPFAQSGTIIIQRLL